MWLVSLDPSILDDLGVLRAVRLQLRGEFRSAYARLDHSQLADLGCDRRSVDRGLEGRHYACDRRLWRSRRRDQPEICRRDDAIKAQLGEGRDGRQVAETGSSADREWSQGRPQIAKQFVVGCDPRRDVAADKVRDNLRAAGERHEVEIDVGRALQHLQRHVLARSRTQCGH